MKFLHQCQYGRDASMCLGIVLENNNILAEYVSYM